MEPSPIHSLSHNFQTHRFYSHRPTSTLSACNTLASLSLVSPCSLSVSFSASLSLDLGTDWGHSDSVAVSPALASPLPAQAIKEAREIAPELNARQIPPPDHKIHQREALAFGEFGTALDILARENEGSQGTHVRTIARVKARQGQVSGMRLFFFPGPTLQRRLSQGGERNDTRDLERRVCPMRGCA